MQASRSLGDGDMAKVSAVGLQDNSWSKGTQEMQGELSLVPTSTLLQSILLSKTTGKLVISSQKDNVQIYFVEGRAVYAEGLGQSGDECLLELMSLRDGKYNFEPRARTEKQNVVTDLETLIVRGVQLTDSITYLRHAGVAPESILLKARKDTTEFELSSSIEGNQAINGEAMLQLYIAIDDRSMLKQVTRMAELKKSEWVPALCHLIEKDFVTFSNEHVKSKSERSNLQGKQIDTSLIHSVMMTLRRPETGMFTYPAFLYFLEQEYFRAYRSSSPLSIILLEMRLVGAPPNFGRDPLDVGAAAEAFRRISKIKRHIDMVCHYDTYDYGLILPNTRTAGANIFARRILKALTSAPLPGIDNNRLSIVMGIATVPDDCVDLAVLLSAAEAAKSQAVKTVSPIVLYQDVV
jgi:GGDEF domain-containing protein